jgi:hypothetical protein
MLDGHVARPSGGARRASVRIAVVEADGVWRLYLDGERVGRFDLRRDALRCALDMARETRLDGCEVEVLTQDRFGELLPAEGASWKPRLEQAEARA